MWSLILPLFFLFPFLSGCSHLNTKGVKRVTSYSFFSSSLPSSFDKLKIVYLSDIHYPSTLKITGLQLLIDQVNELEPDLILLGGDYTEKNKNIIESIKTVGLNLANLQAPLGVFAVLGNHDNHNGRIETLAAFSNASINMLVNDVYWVTRGEQRIAIGGVDEPYWGKPNFSPIANKITPGDFVILLSHNPDFVEKADLSLANLILSGHTHAGQITLFGWAPYTSSRYGQRYKYGQTFSPQGIPLIITSGIGTSKVKLRVGAPSEIVILTLYQLENE